MDKTTPVQMRLRRSTLTKLERLKAMTGVDNRTRLVSSAVDLAEDIAGAIKDGGRVTIERPDGTKRDVHVVGI